MTPPSPPHKRQKTAEHDNLRDVVAPPVAAAAQGEVAVEVDLNQIVNYLRDVQQAVAKSQQAVAKSHEIWDQHIKFLNSINDETLTNWMGDIVDLGTSEASDSSLETFGKKWNG